MDDWNSSSDSTHKNSTYIINSDTVLNTEIIKLIDSLQTNNTDSIIVFSTAYPGYISQSQCDTGLFPITSFIIWNKNGMTFFKKIQGNCSANFTKDSSLQIFDFYHNNSKKFKTEYFMPVILSGHVNKDKTISYTMSSIDHEPNYDFYYKIGSDSKSFHL